MDKQDLRERVWDDLEDSGAARFPFPPHGRIPNFAGADDAAARLAESAVWR
ncbi:5-formyltetrahydrofolate cyclo-ligase, partial [Halobacterium sp. PCN9]|nr:5-formyltetrahydrofolate cyclo-ligase [Halobacterium bonnevillei]